MSPNSKTLTNYKVILTSAIGTTLNANVTNNKDTDIIDEDFYIKLKDEDGNVIVK